MRILTAALAVLCLSGCPDADDTSDGLSAIGDGLRLVQWVTNAKGEACAVYILMASAADAGAEAVEGDRLPTVYADLSDCELGGVVQLSCPSKIALLSASHYFAQAASAWDGMSAEHVIELAGAELPKCDVEEVPEFPVLAPTGIRPTTLSTPPEVLPAGAVGEAEPDDATDGDDLPSLDDDPDFD